MEFLPIFGTFLTDLCVQGHQTEMPEDYQQRFSDILICFEVRRTVPSIKICIPGNTIAALFLETQLRLYSWKPIAALFLETQLRWYSWKPNCGGIPGNPIAVVFLETQLRHLTPKFCLYVSGKRFMIDERSYENLFRIKLLLSHPPFPLLQLRL
jgi:hypothetical protein